MNHCRSAVDWDGLGISLSFIASVTRSGSTSICSWSSRLATTSAGEVDTRRFAPW